ncbi:MAG TPA: methylated-DNA--[protein]-cysteine S-methyltransferase [Rudaea sp.]|jgi:AraC family transcriptional regulator of adaptative response/methylated-DNA-[protein]-cysteine methyltransferase|nr:methylated-DNA--[protein]-cysteine S-methyltransferase [Rudaea sp.]
MTMKPASLDIDPLDRALAILTDNADEAPKLSALAASVGLSPSHLQRAFRKRFGVSPAEYVQSRRLKTLKSALRENERVTDAIYDAGYGSGSRVYEKTGQLLGMTPASYRRGAAGIAIRYTTLDTSLGHLLAATTDRGICSVILGTDEASVVADLRTEFPRATIDRTDAGDDWLAVMIARITSDLDGSPASDAPLPPIDIRATAFQWRVWQALQHIPRGETRSYSDIATSIGEPRAVRAVANACGRNRLAVVVPCHRVIREDGSLGGYRWGIERKRTLLAREGKKVAPH